jgi:hypothetical protein
VLPHSIKIEKNSSTSAWYVCPMALIFNVPWQSILMNKSKKGKGKLKTSKCDNFKIS